MNRRQRNVAVALIVLLAGAFILSGHTSVKLSGVQPGAEGLQIANGGFQPATTDQISAVGQAISVPQGDPNSYAWGSGSAILSASVTKTGPSTSWEIQCPLTGCGTTSSSLYDQAQIPQTSTSSILGIVQGSGFTQTINYNVAINGTAHQHVVGNVVIDTTTLEFKAGGSGAQQFQGDALWFELYTNVWSTQECDPTNTTACQNGYVWAAPLEAVITGTQQIGCTVSTFDCTTSTSGTPSNDQLNPMSTGAGISLYTGVGSTAPVNSLGLSSGGVQQSLQSGGSPLAPDDAMSEYTFFPIQLQDFGPYACPAYGIIPATCYPDVTLTITVYYLIIGSFLWTNPNHTTYVPTPSCSSLTCTNIVAAISQWLDNPLDQFYMLAVVAIIVFSVVYVIGKKIPGGKNV